LANGLPFVASDLQRANRHPLVEDARPRSWALFCARASAFLSRDGWPRRHRRNALMAPSARPSVVFFVDRCTRLR
jgi:hypothetical protein